MAARVQARRGVRVRSRAVTALLVIFLVAAAANWYAVARGDKRLEYAAKPAALAVLIAAAVVMDPDDSTARAALVVALAFSLAGDVALMLPGRQPGSAGPNMFLVGLGAFLAGHVAYVAAFWIDGVAAGWVAAGVLVAGAVAYAVGRPVVRAVQGSAEPGLAAPVAGYIAVICLMVLSAIGTGKSLAIGGALLFALSDSLIARERFIAQMPGGRVAIIVTYHVAQLLLVLSFE